jgi:hypothetical protein
VRFVLGHLQETVNFVKGVHLGNPTLHTHRQCLRRIRRHQFLGHTPVEELLELGEGVSSSLR